MELTQFETINNHKIATIFHDSGSKNIVIFCHGFRSSTIGPNRFFVRMARQLEKNGISSLRFDQYGSGNSEGDFINSSFNDWVKTIEILVQKYTKRGYKVALLGQSMGGAAVLVAGSNLQEIVSCIVAWVPDASIDAPNIIGDYHEESGQRVEWKFWIEAHSANIVKHFKNTVIPEYVFFADNDQYVSQENQNALRAVVQSTQKIEVLKGYTHSGWSYDEASSVINKSVEFIMQNFSI